jgi:AcrR family transcriptional regulator
LNTGMKDGRRQTLVHCAKKAFASRGYYSTSISQIVEEAGIARGTFYQYFDNKLHIFQSILDSFLQDLQDRIKPIKLGPGRPPPVVQIQENLTRVLDLVLREKDLTRVMLHHTSTPDHTVEKQQAEFYEQLALMIERSLNQGMSMKLIRPCNTTLTAHSIIGAVKEVVFRVTSSQEAQPSVEVLVKELMEFGLGGILAEPRNSLFESNPRHRMRGFLPVPNEHYAGVVCASEKVRAHAERGVVTDGAGILETGYLEVRGILW